MLPHGILSTCPRSTNDGMHIFHEFFIQVLMMPLETDLAKVLLAALNWSGRSAMLNLMAS